MKYKKLIVSLLTAFLMAPLASAASSHCDIANVKACVLDLDNTEIFIAVHNSGLGYDGVQIYTNQNHGLSMRSLLKDIDILVDNNLAMTSTLRNVVNITDVSGTLPPMFVVDIKIVSRTGETIREIIERNTKPGVRGSSELIVIPIPSEN